MKTRPGWHVCIACIYVVLLPAAARAELVSLDWHTREPFAGGKAYGEAGAYEKLVGVARFAIDPTHPRNRLIVDIENAPRNDRGLVEFATDVFLLSPREPSRGNGALFYEVSNRGKK